MLRLINQLLEFRKMQNNKLALSLEETDVMGFLHEIFLSFKDTAASKNMDFRFQPSVASYKMFIDKGNLDKVGYNLLSNAFKYTDNGKSITVTLKEENNWLILQVSDTGAGIPINKQGKVFERFYQIESQHIGSGIGLSLVQRLVELHHGQITLVSEVGKGSTFSIYIPQDKSVYTAEELAESKGEMEEQRVYSTNAHEVYTDDVETEAVNKRREAGMEQFL